MTSAPGHPVLRLDDLYQATAGGRPHSINFITCHDGFTLADLVSYNEKHNEANGEGNRDGSDDNRSLELRRRGADRRPAVLALRERQAAELARDAVASQGVPMLLGGDELRRTQHGNNNAWCQDNEISWFDWCSRRGAPAGVHARLIELRRSHPSPPPLTSSPDGERLRPPRHLVVQSRRSADGAVRLAGGTASSASS